jgi:hypothetical protein
MNSSGSRVSADKANFFKWEYEITDTGISEALLIL